VPGYSGSATVKKGKSGSALLFTGECRKTVGAGCYLALLYAGFARGEFGFNGQRAAPASSIAAGIFPALIANPVFHGAYLRGIHAAYEIEPVTGCKSAGGLAGRFGGYYRWYCSRDRWGRNFPTRVQGAAGREERCGKEDNAYAGKDD
jgi:hypothetical protein